MEPDGSPLVSEHWVPGKQIVNMVEDEGIDVKLANEEGGLWGRVWLERMEGKRGGRRGGCEVDDLAVGSLIVCEVNQSRGRPSSHAAEDNNKSNKSNQIKMIVLASLTNHATTQKQHKS